MAFGDNVDRLGRFADQYRFFSLALPYLFGRLSDDQLVDFLEQYGRECPLLHHRFRRPIFRGMDAPDGDGTWNRVLFAVEAEHFPHLENFLLGVTVADAGARTVYRIGAQDVRVADPLFVDRAAGMVDPATVPALDLVVFGVDGSRERVSVFWDDVAPVLSIPTVVTNPPLPRTTLFAKHTFSGDNADAALALSPDASDFDANRLRLQAVGDLPAGKRDELLRSAAEFKKGHRP